ncbi:hypothetical protein [Haliea sp.]|uniref:hypothetical protein n=1 Tax=Haliea sp. TaxID=1932666 RepID=UPI0025BA9A6F|nr:hypothetical protein [Haliea sp.]|tara:strand:+ start:3485 stop:3697 length:213 start_codon:yes stop_codon:yes gene_type:complete
MEIYWKITGTIIIVFTALWLIMPSYDEQKVNKFFNDHKFSITVIVQIITAIAFFLSIGLPSLGVILEIWL